MQGPEKNSYKEFDNEKKFLRLENSPPPPITFLMVRPLSSLPADVLWGSFVTHSFVTNEPQRTSAGRLAFIRPPNEGVGLNGRLKVIWTN